mmetsp:Transcript_25341/g.46751  ORF Transcript_25341/g.46751 Transcript_25341/m.46751 type:complete len:238 (+) Transcript_25341:913-1626(+)
MRSCEEHHLMQVGMPRQIHNNPPAHRGCSSKELNNIRTLHILESKMLSIQMCRTTPRRGKKYCIYPRSLVRLGKVCKIVAHELNSVLDAIDASVVSRVLQSLSHGIHSNHTMRVQCELYGIATDTTSAINDKVVFHAVRNVPCHAFWSDLKPRGWIHADALIETRKIVVPSFPILLVYRWLHIRGLRRANRRCSTIWAGGCAAGAKRLRPLCVVHQGSLRHDENTSLHHLLLLLIHW